MSDFLPVLLGSDANVYGMARSFYQQYGVRSVAICKGALVATSNTNLVKIAVLEPDLENDETFVKTLTDYAKAHADKPLVLVAAGTPPEAPGSNALPNLDLAVQYLLSGAKDGVQIAYDGLHPAWATTEADCNDRFLRGRLHRVDGPPPRCPETLLPLCLPGIANRAGPGY